MKNSCICVFYYEILEWADLEACECNQVNALFAGSSAGVTTPTLVSALYCLQRTLLWQGRDSEHPPQTRSEQTLLHEGPENMPNTPKKIKGVCGLPRKRF